jgi:prepilin-type N-terminal cleavage/methylation domain-containing protein
LHHGLSPAGRSKGHCLGFTLIELVVAMAILLVVMIGVLSAISFAYTSSNDTEMRNTAKNVASYTLEYLRARTVTRGASGLMASLGMTLSSTGTYGWYDASANSSGLFPSMIDAENLPLQSNGKPCNYLWTYVKSASAGQGNDGRQNAGTPAADISAAGQIFNFSSMHAALPTDTFSTTTRLAWTTTLQGYASVRARLPNDDATSLPSTQNPAPEDANLARMLDASTNDANGRYRTRLTDLTSAGAWTGLIVQYPGIYPSTQPIIASFTRGSTYVPKVWTTDSNKILKTSQEYNPCYTNGSDGTTKAATQDYRGFRVLTAIVARSTLAVDVNGFRHVQYYDVTVTVLWMNGTHESNYELTSQIVAY